MAPRIKSRSVSVKVARGFFNMAYRDVGAKNLPEGQTAPEFVRRNLDQLGLGRDLQRIRRGSHEYVLPPSTLPGAAPAAQSKGRGQSQNTRLAKDARLALAEHKRAQLEAQRVEAETRMERPRNTRSDKGKKRWPRANRRAGHCIVFYL